MSSLAFRSLAPLFLAFAATAAAAQPPQPVVQSADEALTQDAAEYARQHNVAPDEAVRRLRAQEETVAETDRLAARFAKRLAGISIEDAPDYRIVVLLTGSKPVPDETVEAGGMNVPIVFRTGAPATRQKIVKAIDKHGDAIRSAFPQARGMGADPRTGELVVMMSEGDTEANDPAATASQISDIAGVPTRIETVERTEANTAVEGGARVVGNDAVTGHRSYCTVGFVVTDGTRNGIVTAAHCPDVLNYAEPDGTTIELPFVGQWGWSFQDVQVNEAPTKDALFYADTKKTLARVPAGQRARASTRAGDFVCHRGEHTGYSCGEVELTDYAPPGTLCGGPCAPDWVTVRGGDCGGGDSGGPVFSGDVAFGIMKGAAWDREGKCGFYYYMSLDYLPKGWSLVTRDSALLPGTGRGTARSAVEGAPSLRGSSE